MSARGSALFTAGTDADLAHQSGLMLLVLGQATLSAAPLPLLRLVMIQAQVINVVGDGPGGTLVGAGRRRWRALGQRGGLQGVLVSLLNVSPKPFLFLSLSHEVVELLSLVVRDGLERGRSLA